MATDSMVAGLFATPEMYQQQQDQLAQQQAIQMAQLTPEQRAQTDIRGGFQRAGNAIGGLMGAQDPQMKLMAMRQQVLQGLDPNDAASIGKAAQALAQAGDQQGAMQLAQKAQEAAFKQSQITKNNREGNAAMMTTEQRNAAAIADSSGATRGTPEWTDTYKTELTRLTAKTPKEPSLPEVAKLQQYRAQLVAQVGESDPQVKQVDAAIAKATRQGKTLEETMGAGLAAIANAMAGAQAKKAAEAGGTEVGKQVAAIEGNQSALEAIKGAKNIFDKGIYAGKYGPTLEGLAGYSEGVLGSKERLSNTETFRSFLGDVVIPGLKDFGGSDTVEELKYLQGVYAGDTTVQPKALKAMLDRAEKKITSKISRIQEQQQAIQQGKPLPTGPMPTQAVRTWNPVTRKFE